MTTKKKPTPKQAKQEDRGMGVTLVTKDPPPRQYGDRGQKYPYEEAAEKLGDSPTEWISLRRGTVQIIDQFRTRFRQHIELPNGWELELRSVQDPGQDETEYKDRTTELFGRIIETNPSK